MAEDSGFAMGYALGQDSGGGGNSNNGGFGDLGGIWGILALLLILGGIGGFGGYGGFGGGGGGQALTRAELYDGFAIQNIDSAVRNVQNGIADSTYALTGTITNGFHGVDSALCNLGYAMKDCCCETQRLVERGFCDMGQAINMQTRDIIDNQNANYRGMMDFLVTEKLAAKDAKIAELNTQISQANQNAVLGARIDAAVAEILRRTGNDCPTAAYLVQPPTPVNFPTNGCGAVQFGGGWGNNGCGC